MPYADTIRSVTATFNDVANLIDGTLVRYAQVSTSGLISTTSGSGVDYTGSTLSVPTNAGEVVYVSSRINVSASASAIGIFSAIFFGGTAYQPVGRCLTSRANTAGYDEQIVTTAIATVSSGTQTIKTVWGTGGGTAYSLESNLIVLVFRNS